MARAADLIKNLQKRYPNVISKHEGLAIIDSIEDFIKSKLENNEQLSIDKFGIITSYHFHGHKAVGLDKVEWYVEEFKLVKFITAFVYKKLLVRKKRELAQKGLTE